MTPLCESCRRHPATRTVDFGDGGTRFAVCDGCAEWASGAWVVVHDMETGEEGAWV